MNFVEPIRDRKKIAQIKNLLRGQQRFRDLLLFTLGINSALRISDLLQLKIGDLIDDHQRVRRRFWIKVSPDYVSDQTSCSVAFNMQVSNLSNFGKCL